MRHRRGSKGQRHGGRGPSRLLPKQCDKTARKKALYEAGQSKKDERES